MTLRLTSLTLALALAAPLAAAESATPVGKPGREAARVAPDEGTPGGGHRGGRMAQAKQESFTEESTRKMADGRVFKRQVEQKVEEGRFYRREVMTNPEGKTATRTVTATLDKARQTWTRKVEGVDVDGSAWSRTQDVPVRHGPDHEGADAVAAEKSAPEPKAAGRKKAN